MSTNRKRLRDEDDDDIKRKAKPAPPKSTLKLSALGGERKNGGASKPVSSVSAMRPPPVPSPLASSSQSSVKKASQPLSQHSPPKLSRNGKGKGKEASQSSHEDTPDEGESAMWVDLYEPQTEDDLVVHKKKVEQVRIWLREASMPGVLRKYRRILALTGPAGAGKTATLRVLANELNLEIVEWRNATEDTPIEGESWDRESASSKFANFLSRAGSYGTLLGASTSASTTQQRIIVLEDLPNVLHATILSHFQSALVAFTEQPYESSCPLVIVVSDVGVRGELRDEHGFGSFGSRDATNTVSIRTLLPTQLQSSPFVQQVAFNPVAPTRMRKALQVVLANEEPKRKGAAVTELLDAVVGASSGDIRSAIMALQFACVVDSSAGGGKKAGKKKASKDILEAVTKRESSLALFHMLGKILYNKRKGDPPNASASGKEAERQREADRRIPNPPKLAPHLREEHARPASRVDINSLYADAPVDTSLLSLYLHQNYPQFTGDIEHCSAVADQFSDFDVGVRTDEQTWGRTMPHQFHVLTLGLLHNLPTPVPRTGQKLYKPELFDVFKRTHDAEIGARDVRAWLASDLQFARDDEMEMEREYPPPRVWNQNEVVLELGGVLTARDSGQDPPPSSHERFSRLVFVEESSGGGRKQTLDEDGAGEADEDENDDDDVLLVSGAVPKTLSVVEREREHGWLEADMITDE